VKIFAYIESVFLKELFNLIESVFATMSVSNTITDGEREGVLRYIPKSILMQEHFSIYIYSIKTNLPQCSMSRKSSIKPLATQRGSPHLTNSWGDI